MDGRSLGSTYKISKENLKSHRLWSFIHRRGTSYIYLWSRIHNKQSTRHTFKRRYQRLRSTDSKPHLAWAFIVKLCTRCISRQRNQLSKKEWRAAQAATNMFCSRWLQEYLPTLVQRRKWNYPTQNLNVGDLVVIQTGNVPRSHWPLGCIIETYPGVDRVVQTVKVKTSNNEFYDQPKNFA